MNAILEFVQTFYYFTSSVVELPANEDYLFVVIVSDHHSSMAIPLLAVKGLRGSKMISFDLKFA